MRCPSAAWGDDASAFVVLATDHPSCNEKEKYQSCEAMVRELVFSSFKKESVTTKRGKNAGLDSGYFLPCIKRKLS